MIRSSIQPKKKVCVSCGHDCYWFSRKRCKLCARIEDSKPIARVSARTKERVSDKAEASAELERWFLDRRKEMIGVCVNCGRPSCKNDDKYYKFSLAHLLPKAYVKSVATHPSNFLELCFWGDNSCHTNFDNGMLDLTQMNCWDEIVRKFQEMYPSISREEKRRIPEILLQYIGTDI